MVVSRFSRQILPQATMLLGIFVFYPGRLKVWIWSNDMGKMRCLLQILLRCFRSTVAITELLTHGGELVAFRGPIASKPIPEHILFKIRESLLSELRFAAKIIANKKAEICCMTVYCW